MRHKMSEIRELYFMDFETIRWDEGKIVLLDQTRLPEEFVERTCKTVQELHEAIRTLAVRGAPLLGVIAAFGLYLGIKDYEGEGGDDFLKKLKEVSDYIASSRPTAVNLFWSLDRMMKLARNMKGKNIAELKRLLLEEAMAIKYEDKELCLSIGKNGEPLIKDGDVILTHCNAGALATAGIGTALSPLYVAHEGGKRFKVYVDETRPLLQGSRLTAWELMRNGINAELICDNMAASLMQKGIIKKVIVGADRIAANGDTANKIGTYSLAVLARYHRIPFYVAAPYSTFDFSIPEGEHIPIEERKGEELKIIGSKQIAPHEVNTYNPAFDVTPYSMLTAFITEKNVIYPPFDATLKQINPKA